MSYGYGGGGGLAGLRALSRIVEPNTTGPVLDLGRYVKRPVAAASKVSGAASISVAGTGIVSLTAGLAAGASVNAVVTATGADGAIVTLPLIVTGAGAAAARRAGNNIGYALGNSRTLDNVRAGASTTLDPSNPVTTNGSRTNVGPEQWLRAMLLGKLSLVKEHINGVGGATVAEIRTNQLPHALASPAKILILTCVVNSINAGVSAATAVAEYADICNQWVNSAPDRVVLGWDEVPVAGSSFPSRMRDARDALRLLHNPAAGIYIAPTYAAIAAEPDGLAEKAGTYRDGIHWTINSAIDLAFAKKASAEALLPLDTPDATTRAGLLTGTSYGLTADSQFIQGGGSVTGWTLPAVAGVTYSSEVADGHVWLVVTVNAVANLNLLILPSASAIPAGVTPGTSLIDASILHKWEGASNIVNLHLAGRRQSGGTLPDAQGDNGGDMLPMGSTFFATNGALPTSSGGTLMLRANAMILDGASTSLRPWAITIQGMPTSAVPGATASGVFKFALPQYRAV